MPRNHTGSTFNTSSTFKYWQESRENGILTPCWWECKMIQPLLETVWQFPEKLSIYLMYNSAIPLLGIYWRKIKICLHNILHTNATSFWKESKCLLIGNKLWCIHTMENSMQQLKERNCWYMLRHRWTSTNHTQERTLCNLYKMSAKSQSIETESRGMVAGNHTGSTFDISSIFSLSFLLFTLFKI